ncbi:ADP-ribosyltransferase-containing protein [Aliarcobacter butzleri]|uniref:ADP-ribosyltransferase-containing protein n=1 Tax=Aliarcobacter butzleri TaxID=28197 RepID=UPI001587711D|nr:hypothetical protein [Aliarcobacter butzleri]NUW28964.1 hypothetical protein [Aliarcobacter butzleri]
MNKLEIFNDDEFKSLDTEKKNQVLTNYFNTNLADDDYKSLDSEKQTSILQNFISSQLTSDKELKSEELPKKDKSFIDKAKEFGKNYVDDVADTFIGARPFGTEDKAKDLKDKVFENVFGGLGGVQEAKSLDLKLENKEDAQQQEKLKATLDNKNDEKIDDSLIRSIEGLARTDIRLIGEATSEQKNDYLKNVAGILGKGGYALGQNDKGEYIAVDKQGNEKSITNDFFGGLLDTIVADAGEISGAMYGAKKGLEASKNIKNPLLKAGAVATSSAMGAMTGTALDTAINELRGNQNLGVVDYLNEMSKSAVLDAVGSAVGYGIIKVGGKIVELPKQARDYILNGNLNGAREILKKDLKIDEQFIEDALQQAQNNYKEVGEYANKGLTDKSRQQEELLAATLEKGDANIIKGAISTNETAARNLADTIDKRATNIYDELEKKSSKVGGEEIKNYLSNFENTTKQNFSNMRKDFDEAFKEVDYKFELEDLGLNSVFKDMSKRVQDPDAKQRFLTLQTAIKNTIYDSNAQVGIERDINGLLDLRQQLNKFYGQNERYLANKKDKDTFNSLKENIDNQIYKAVNDNLPEEVGTRLIDSFSKSMQGYRELGTLQDNKVFNGIMGEAKNPEFRMDNLIKHMADDDSYVDDVLSKMTPNARQTVEVAVIRDITDSFTAKTAQGQKAIAFEDLGKKLQSIKRNVRSELGKETIDNLIAYADKFGNKDLLYLDMAKGIATKPKHNISTTLEGKIKMETASMLFQIVQTLKPGDDAKRLALQRHIGQALEKSRTPNEFATNMYKYPDLTDDSRQILKTLIKNNNKVLAAKNNEEAEAILKQAEVENNKIFEEQNKLKEEIENFKTPDIYEIKTVAGLTSDDRFGSFSQMTAKIQNGTATQNEIEQYLKAKNKISPEVLEKNILKLKYPENAFSVHKLNDLKSFVNEKVNEIISENEFKAMIYNLDKYNHLPNTTTELESKYREKFYKLNKLYDEEKQLIKEQEKSSFEEAEKAGLIPFSKGADNLLAGTVAGVETDEDGNIVGFAPEMFVAGLGGYTALKVALKNKEIQGALKDYAMKIVEYVDMNPALYKKNGLNAMFVGAKSNEIGAFSDIATKKVMKEIDDSIVTFKPIPKQEVEIEGEFFEQNFGKLGDILVHDELFKQYPNLKEVQVSVNNNIGRSATYNEYINHIALDGGLVKTAENNVIKDLQNKIKELDKNPIDKDYKILNDKFFDKNLPDGEAEKILNLLDNTPTQIEIDKLSNKLSKEIKINKENSKEVELTEEGKITLLHEIQHTIQGRENWARGGGPEEFNLKGSDKLNQSFIDEADASRKTKVEELISQLSQGKISKEEFKKIYNEMPETKTIREWTENIANSKDPFGAYQRLWGEQQARATSYRANYTPEQRISEDWTNTLEKNEGKYNEPIIKYNNKESQLKAEKENLDRLTQWHKDSSPLTKNEDGTPKVFYHGTDSNFDEFKNMDVKNGTRSGTGFYFTTNEKIANSYAKKNNGNIMPVYLNAKNIYTGFDSLNDKQKEIYLKSNKAVNETLKNLGFDARMMGDEIVVFNPTQIKSIHNKGTFNEDNPNIMMSLNKKDFKDKDGFYSVLEKTIDEKVGGRIDSVSLTKMLEKNGVKQDEIEWSGLKNLLETKDKLTKKEIEETLAENRLVLEKVEKGQDKNIKKIESEMNEIKKDLLENGYDEKKEKKWHELNEKKDDLTHPKYDSKYSDYKIDGGENYREILFRVPTNEKGYKSKHWDESNIVVFTRVDDRTIDDKKTLFIEELQSDWHQEGRKKGYGEKIPDAPFKKNWSELGLKRMIQEAVENDYEKIAWTTGKQQTQRYSLEKEIDTVVYNKESGYLQASKDGDEVIFKKVANDEEVSTLLGKELTTRLIDPKHSTRDNIFVIKGEETKFGGDGMKTFYDEIVPNTAKKLLKKYNVKPKLEELDEIEEMVWSIEITPKMKEDIKKYGQPLYAVGGAIAIGTTQEAEAENLHEEQDKLYGDIK